MVIDTNTIKVTAETTLDDVLDAADETAITLERGGATYTVQRGRDSVAEDIWKDYDPQAVMDMLEEFKHNPMDIDATEWIADVYRARKEGSRTDDRL